MEEGQFHELNYLWLQHHPERQLSTSYMKQNVSVQHTHKVPKSGLMNLWTQLKSLGLYRAIKPNTQPPKNKTTFS